MGFRGFADDGGFRACRMRPERFGDFGGHEAAGGKIIRENLSVSANCNRLLDIKKLDKNHYTAKAEVDIPSLNVSGKIIDVAVTYDGDTVLVEIK